MVTGHCLVLSIDAVLLCARTTLSVGDDDQASREPAMVESHSQWSFVKRERELGNGYLCDSPAEWDGKTPLPMVIFLHGAGARVERVGVGLDKLHVERIPELIRGGRTFNAIVMCPHSTIYWSGEQAAAFIDHAMKEFAGRYDPQRIYLTGLSAGGESAG